jgi:hypothetical protein
MIPRCPITAHSSLFPCILLLVFFPQIYAQSAGLAGLEIEEPDNEASWPKNEDWELAIDSNTQLYCPLTPKMKCGSASGSTTISTLSNFLECSNWCPTQTTASFQDATQESSAVSW